MAFRILEVRKSEQGHPRPATLFHGVDGSRTLPLDTWIEAEQKQVHDGSGGTRYQSGFHVFGWAQRQQAVEYLKDFSKERPLVVCRVDARNLRPKSHSPSPVYLASEMRIPSRDWLMAENPIGHPTEVESLPQVQLKQTQQQ